ncbi:STAS domain-containing protein [candidate division KSB1 bacterium]|nr:STAS domain-containing protein [candidate division KSB1 bacterium]
MYVRNKRLDDVEVLSLFGVINAENIGVFHEHIERVLDDDVRLVVLDLEKLEEIDSTGIGGIISLLKRMRQKDGDVRIVRIRGAVKKLFELLRIDRGIDIYESVEEAVK